ncbi:hypothetical protein ACG94X_02495 [Acinetobacter sp. ULE_I010]|uniref:hypothetical protein n=1 Tax=Acinetobacter sp. ULE_I010 TaxID=3373065 RepID=UPI003AF4863F
MYGLKNKSGQKDKGLIRGAGTGTSDDIKKTIPSGSYIMPKDSTDAIGEENLARLGQPTDVNLSNGEFQLTPDQVHSVGVQALEQMKGQTHTPIDQPQLGIKSGTKQPELFFANGGLVSPYPSADDIRKARRGTNVPSAAHAQEFMGKQATATQGGPIQPRGQTFEGQARNVSGNAASTVRPAAPGLPAPPTPPASGGFLANAGSKVLGAAKGLGVFHGIGSMVGGAVEGFNTSTEDYATRMGLDPNADRGELANFGIRAAGVLSDVGNKATFGMLGNRFDDKNLNQAKGNLAEQQQRFAVINAQRSKSATQAPPVNSAPIDMQQQMNDALYGQDTPQGKPQASAPSNDPYKINQQGNSFSYANPSSAAQARASGVPETQSTGIKGVANDPKGVANFMANTREMGASQEQIDRAVQQSMNSGQGFGIQYPSRPTRTDEQEAERKNVLQQISAPIQGARGMTSNQRAQLMEMQTGEDTRATTMYNTDANNATSQSNNTANNAASIAQTGMREQGSNDRAVLGENGQNTRYGLGLQQDREKFNREMSLTETKEGFGVRNAARVEKLNEMYDKAETDEQRQSIQQRINRLTGAKDQSGKDRYMTVGGGQEYNQEQGVMINRPQQIFDTQTGRMLNMDGTPVGGNSETINKDFDSSKFKDGSVYQSPSTGEYFRWDAKSQRQIPVQQ